jgi:hypothetical protein
LIPPLVLALASVAGMSLPVSTIDGDVRSFPQDADLPRSVFVVTFTKAATGQGAAWSRKLRDAGEALGAAVFQVSVIEDVPKMFRSSVISGMARQLPQPIHSRFWVAAEQCVELVSRREAYVFVVDRRDRIVWRAHGDVTDARLQEITTLPR